MRRYSDVACLLLLVILPILFFWGVLFTNRFMIPFDGLDQHYPYDFFAARAIQQGHFALWTPYLFAGYPAIGDSLYTIAL